MAKLYFPKDTQDAKRLSALARRGHLHRIRQGVYTDAAVNDIPRLLASRWYEVVEHLCKKPLVVYRTAHELKPYQGHVFIMAAVKKRTQITVGPSLKIEVFPGDTITLTEQFVPGLARSALPRQLLENLAETRSTAKVPKTLGAQWVEEKLCQELQLRSVTALNNIRDQARTYATSTGLAKEWHRLNKIISAILSTQTMEGVLATPLAIATAKQQPFDASRVHLFESFARYLRDCRFAPVSYHYNASSWRNLAFFESYFSNFIEGTEFEIDEAEEIVFSRKIIDYRHEDSHDILAVYDVVSDYQEMSETPHTPDELLELIQRRHALIMAERKDKRPGQFKLKNNKVGNTVFVTPDNLIGTLSQGFKPYLNLPKGMPRALFMQFLIAECHPFDDGNGRLSRIMMNAELHAMEQYKVILPTVHRDSYLNGLRQATRHRTLVKVFFQLQRYTADIHWQDYGEAREQLESHQAQRLPDEGIAEFNKQIRAYKMDLPLG